MAAGAPKPAAFLDRDGVINRDDGYVHRPEDFHWMAGAKEAIRLLNERGFLVFVVTNQAGIARGLYQPTDVERLHGWMSDELASIGAHIDAFYFCPHHPTIGDAPFLQICDCRKPAPGMLLRAMREWPVALEGSFMIGDRDSDLEAAAAAGVRPIAMVGEDTLRVVRSAIGAADFTDPGSP